VALFTSRVECICGDSAFAPVFSYLAPPANEPRYHFENDEYRREIVKCKYCGHYRSIHAMDINGLYEDRYTDAVYNDIEGMRTKFHHIISLPEEQSDNAGRVQRIRRYVSHDLENKKIPEGMSILDVGSGLCVFLYEMKQLGFTCTAIDPDKRAVEHAKQTVGVGACCYDFKRFSTKSQYDIISFNKMLEHDIDPIALLHRCRRFLKSDGFVYVELPDGETAEDQGMDREEFFIDHYHVFSPQSVTFLSSKSGFRLRILERITEPSGKFTFRAFLTP